MSESKEKHKFRPLPRAPRPGGLARWIPAGILVLVILAFLSAVLPPRVVRVGPGEPSAWLPMARGEITFLGTSSPFRLLRRGLRDAFRAEEPPGTAFESSRLEALMQMFLRQRLAAVQVKETIRLRLEVEPGEGTLSALQLGMGKESLDWRITFRDVSKDGEAWYLFEQEIGSNAPGQGAPSGAGSGAGTVVQWRRGPLWGEALRSLAELKEKVARELAREVLALFPDAV